MLWIQIPLVAYVQNALANFAVESENVRSRIRRGLSYTRILRPRPEVGSKTHMHNAIQVFGCLISALLFLARLQGRRRLAECMWLVNCRTQEEDAQTARCYRAAPLDPTAVRWREALVPHLNVTRLGRALECDWNTRQLLTNTCCFCDLFLTIFNWKLLMMFNIKS